MQFFGKFLVLSVAAVATVSGAINKKSDDNPTAAYSSNYHHQGASQYNPSGVDQGPQQMQAGNPGSNLYYYYYPTQDQKSKDQYSHNQQMSGPSHDISDQGPMETAASDNQGVSYASQDQDYGQNQQQSFDPAALNNLASQLQAQMQAQGFGQQQGYDMQNFGNQAEASGPMGQFQPNYQNQMAFPSQGPNFGPGQFYPQQAVQTQASEITSSITSGLKKYGLTSILMPVLALAGLSLLLPTVTSLGATTTKTKRSVDDASGGYNSYFEKLDAYYKMYNKAMEREECMMKMICELG